MRQKDKLFSKIVLNNLQRERRTFSRYACKNIEGVRKYPDREKVPDRENLRPVFSHDTDRIMYSHSYARYIDKTQVFYLFENDHITHRVLHVQLVSKIGRVIGRCLRLNEDLIEAISLGHDLGHAPYGHYGEEILHKLCMDNRIGCFRHNAQSVRLLMEIEQGMKLEQRGRGLNLSLQVLDGILAHNGEMVSKKYKPNYDKTWERFEEEYSKCFTEENYSKKIFPMTLEGCVVRISDVIAYIGKDIEDAITVKLIRRNEIPQEIVQTLGNSNDKIVNKLVLDLIKNSCAKDYLAFSEDIFQALKGLKKFNKEKIYRNPRIRTENSKIEHMFKLLFNRYLKDLESNSQDSYIYKYRKGLDEVHCKNTHNKRVVIDSIAGMTDDFFNDQHKELFVPQSYGHQLKPKMKDNN